MLFEEALTTAFAFSPKLVKANRGELGTEGKYNLGVGYLLIDTRIHFHASIVKTTVRRRSRTSRCTHRRAPPSLP
jgi:hypothetical protein